MITWKDLIPDLQAILMNPNMDSWIAGSENLRWLTVKGLLQEIQAGSKTQYILTAAGRAVLAQAAEDTATAATAGERETYLRNDLFKRVKDTLELTLAYLPGELAEFPEKVQTVVSDFSNYCNIAEKQIQEREAELATARKQVAELTAELKASEDEYKRLIHEMNHWGYES